MDSASQRAQATLEEPQYNLRPILKTLIRAFFDITDNTLNRHQAGRGTLLQTAL